jgi:hypothetical protein
LLKSSISIPDSWGKWLQYRRNPTVFLQISQIENRPFELTVQIGGRQTGRETPELGLRVFAADPSVAPTKNRNEESDSPQNMKKCWEFPVLRYRGDPGCRGDPLIQCTYPEKTI